MKRTDLRADGGGSPGVEVVRELTKDSPSRWPKRKELALRVRVSDNSAQTTPAMYNLRDYEDEARTFTCRKLESPPKNRSLPGNLLSEYAVCLRNGHNSYALGIHVYPLKNQTGVGKR